MALTVEKTVLGEIDTNTYILKSDSTNEAAVIDPAVESEKLLSALDGKDVKYILLTHGHFDHITGTKSVKDKTGAKVVIHENDAPCLKDENQSLFCVNHPNEQQPKTDADIIVHDGDELEFGGETVKIMHTPGHTKGGVCYIFEKSRIIFSGDTLFRLTAGRTDFPGGSGREELKSLSRIAQLKGDYTVYCGHGSDTTLDFERDNNRYIRMRTK